MVTSEVFCGTLKTTDVFCQTETVYSTGNAVVSTCSHRYGYIYKFAIIVHVLNHFEKI